MNRRVKGLIVLVCACALIFGLIIFVLIPRAAAITLPYRWGNIPVGQPKAVVHQYLGNPASSIPGTDTWRASRESGEYELDLTYGTDSLAASYKLYFNYHLGFFHKQYLLVQK
ncbi:MAG TPA: hypothetical protein VG738_20200 [Chitinophagaceae bacterium]|nr:hypothetical protein [Chitinophagaceae bacterium]